jgi:hypothetical protein
VRRSGYHRDRGTGDKYCVLETFLVLLPVVLLIPESMGSPLFTTRMATP